MATELLPTESSALATIQLCLWTASMFSHSSKWTVVISWELTMGQPLANIIPLIITKILEVGTTVSSFIKAWRSKVTYRGRCCSQEAGFTLFNRHTRERRSSRGQLERAHRSRAPKTPSGSLTPGNHPVSTQKEAHLYCPTTSQGFLWGPNEITYMKSLENSKAFDKYHVINKKSEDLVILLRSTILQSLWLQWKDHTCLWPTNKSFK